MFCPKCATQNADGARFCRLCGANISLVPMAVNGQLTSAAPEEPDIRDDCQFTKRGRRKRRVTVEDGIKQLFVGLGFIFVSIALAYSVMGTGWWFWMLIPAFSCIGSGVSMISRAKRLQATTYNQIQSEYKGPQSTPLNSPRAQEMMSPGKTGELFPQPPSVTEGTTRHLGVEAPTRHFSGLSVDETQDR
jgi:hypothetical protein